MSQNDPMIGKKFFNKYTLVKKLGEGSFGQIFAAKYGEEEYALKFENKTKSQPLLETEAYIMSFLKGRKFTLLIK